MRGASFYLSIALALSRGLVGSAQDAGGNRLDAGSNQMLRSPDKAFVLKAAQRASAEIQLGKAAANKAGSADVKAFGQQMVDDFTKTLDQLKAIARDEHMSFSDVMSSPDQATIDKLNKLSGDAFDKGYLAVTGKNRTADVKMFEHEGNRGADPAIKNFAAETLPTFQSHLDKLKTIGSSSARSPGQ